VSSQAPDRLTGHAYWKERTRTLGARAVVSTDHPEATGLDDVTAGHRAILLPVLAGLLDGTERTLLDLGCGSGRLTADLAATLGSGQDGRAIGVDPVPALLALAPPHRATAFRLLEDGGELPLDDAAVDVVFTLTVLGGLLGDGELDAMAAEIRRVLRPGGLVFLAESVSEDAAVEHWSPRSVGDYAEAFAWAPLREVARFVDAGDPISVLAGRAA
jgi:SAM-dependent methyltransferase